VGRGRVISGFVHGRNIVTPQSSDPHCEASLGRVALTPCETWLDRLVIETASPDRQRSPASWLVDMPTAEEPRAWPA
jgi:hypothetical protein